jgi:hypothetical protein
MALKLGIVNLLLATKAVGELGSATGDVFADGKVSIGDMQYAGEFFSAMRDASDVEWSALLPEVEDLDADERAQVAAAFREHLKIEGHEVVEEVIEQGFEVLSYGLEALQSLKKLWEKFKPAA